jgi:hypothetical protein
VSALPPASGGPHPDPAPRPDHDALRLARIEPRHHAEVLGRLTAFTRALAHEGRPDLAGLGLAVRQLRALAG